MMTKPNIESRIADRRRLEAVARWCETQSKLARRKGDERDAKRFDENSMASRWRQR
jgi:hypothetical protein